MATLNNALNAVNAYLCENEPSRINYNLDLILQGWIGSKEVDRRSIQERLDIFDSYRSLRDFFQTLEKILRTKHSIKTRDAAILDAIATFRVAEYNTVDHLDKLIDGWDESPISSFDGLEGVGIEVTETYGGLFDLIIVLIRK